MGGKGSGGWRWNAGRKPNSSSDNSKKVSRGTLPAPPVAASNVVSMPTAEDRATAESAAGGLKPPADFSERELWAWNLLSPFAIENGTLTTSSLFAFTLLCRNVALERKLAESFSRVGGPDHRGLLQRLDCQLLAFGLRPQGGAEMPDAEPKEQPEHPLAKFGFGVRRSEQC